MKVRGIPLPLSQSCRDVNPQLVEKSELRGRARTRVGLRCGMNKTESEFALILRERAVRNQILNYRFGEVKLQIGEGCWYLPDFFVERAHPLKPLFIEIKGFMRDDARVKFLTAKKIHGTWATFEMWRKEKSGWKQIL